MCAKFYVRESSSTDTSDAGKKSAETIALREKIAVGCEQLIWDFFNAGGQVVIYDANNGSREARQKTADKFDQAGIHVIFLGAPPSA